MRKCIAFIAMCLFLASCSSTEVKQIDRIEAHVVEQYSEFDAGGYITFEDLSISYDGRSFTIENTRNDIVRVSVMVVNTKTDGTYDLLQIPAFYWKDGEALTNLIRPGEIVSGTPEIFDLSKSGYPSPDPNSDGYYEIAFVVHPDQTEEHVTTSTSDPTSDIYLLKAQQ